MSVHSEKHTNAADEPHAEQHQVARRGFDDVNDENYVHPETQSLFAVLPFMRYIPLASEAMSGYGPRPIFSLGVCYFFNKGLSNQLMNSATYALLVSRFGIDAMRYQRLGSMGTLGWSLNPFTAMMCDTFACLGYTKRWYM